MCYVLFTRSSAQNIIYCKQCWRSSKPHEGAFATPVGLRYWGLDMAALMLTIHIHLGLPPPHPELYTLEKILYSIDLMLT